MDRRELRLGRRADDRFTAIRGAFLLVLDDLGTENTTPWAREKLYQIFNHRYVERLPIAPVSTVPSETPRGAVRA